MALVEIELGIIILLLLCTNLLLYRINNSTRPADRRIQQATSRPDGRKYPLPQKLRGLAMEESENPLPRPGIKITQGVR